VVKTYTDRASGTNEERRELEQLLADARRRRFDMVIVPRF
jgi:DNA invertase Pin-like site-specific DNA recombinase